MQELNRKKLVVLIPFQLLKLRRIIASHPSPENFLLLQNQLSNDILYSIKANEQAGNITTDDANQLWELTSLLLNQIYKHYEELGEYQNMKPLLEGALELPNDKYRIRIDELEQENTGLVQEKAAWEKEKDSLKKENSILEKEIQRLQELLKQQNSQ